MAKPKLKGTYKVGQAIKIKLAGFVYVGKLGAIDLEDGEYPLKVLFPCHNEETAAKLGLRHIDVMEKEVYRG